MKRFAMLMFAMMMVTGFVIAENSIAEQLSKLQVAHQDSIQNFGYALLRSGKTSFAVAGKDLVSVVSGDQEMSFYTETRGKKIFTHLTIEPGNRSSEIVFVFDNKITINDNTFTLKYKMIYTFGKEFGYIIVTENNMRWNWEKCWNCVKCAGGNIGELYNAYKECGLNWQCWINKYQILIDLYSCVKDNCVGCFTE